jgi:hypothetical protein
LEVGFLQGLSGLREEGARIIQGFAVRAGKPGAAELSDSLPDVVLQSLNLPAQCGFLNRILLRLE